MVFDILYKFYNDYDEKNRDHRTGDWFMGGSLAPSFIICAIYPILVQVGKKLMRNREPYQINGILKIYNFVMVIWSAYMVYEFLMAGWLFDYNFIGCQLVDKSDNPKAVRMAKVCWWFFISKFVELLDTAFFILRKKNNQVSFLHVFHHGVMPVTMYFGLRFSPGGHCTIMCLINSAVHVLMYSYYGLSAFGPRFQKYLWWKKYITKIQLTQFFIIILHTSQFFFIECDFPMFFCIWELLYAFIFVALFSNFYIKQYFEKQSKEKSVKAQ